MAKNKISEWSSNPASNTDVGGIDINEGCAPSGINNAIREVMAQVKDMQAGLDDDNFTVAGTLAVTGGLTLDGQAGTSGQVMVSAGTGNTPAWGNAFVAGMIMMWSGTIATIPSGWALCDGNNGTPDLRSKFIVGANADDAGVAKTNITGSATQTGGSKDAIVVSHTHTITDPGHLHTIDTDQGDNVTPSDYISTLTNNNAGTVTTRNSNTATTGITINSEGVSGTNANLPPYYALAMIMKL